MWAERGTFATVRRRFRSARSRAGKVRMRPVFPVRRENMARPSTVTAFLAVRFLMRYFETNTLLPFAIYCAAAGTASAVYFAVS